MKRIYILLFVYCLLPIVNCFSQGTWAQKTNFGGLGGEGAVGFSIGNKGYIGTGRGNNLQNDFWEWDQATNTWTQKANVPGLGREFAVGFSIGSKGYIGAGISVIPPPPANNQALLNDFWEWDQATNTWSQKANVPVVRAQAVGFSIGNKGYIGTGWDGVTGYHDFWEWNQATNSWTQKNSYPGNANVSAVGFAIGTKGYIGTGYIANTNGVYSDFWEWDQTTNIWTQKANFGGGARMFAVGFSIGRYGFLGTGYVSSTIFQDWWRYDPFNNTWTQDVNFGGGVRYGAAAFSIGCKGYVGIGQFDLHNAYNPIDFWEYDPGVLQSHILATAFASSNTLCAGQIVTLTACCAPSYSWSTGATTNPATVAVTAATTYTVVASDSLCGKDTALVSVTITPPPTVNISGVSTLCQGLTTTLSASGGNTYLWNTGSTNATVVVSPTASTNYSVVAYAICGSDTVSINTTVFPKPTAMFSSLYSIVDTCTFKAIMTLTDNSINASSWQWNIYNNGTIDYSTQNPSFIFSVPANYTIALIASSDKGCLDTAKQTINIPSIVLPPIYIPNAFSPNNDGDNDILFVYGKCINEIKFSIYNRWGETVFQTTNQFEGWNGSFNNKEENTAVYTYYFEGTLSTGEIIKKKGNISLIR